MIVGFGGGVVKHSGNGRAPVGGGGTEIIVLTWQHDCSP